MPQAATLLTVLNALIHLLLMIAEIFFWKQPFIHERLGFTLAEAIKVAPIVANAGLYNGFIGSGLIWGLASGVSGTPIKIFFLVCVIIAGLFGAITLRPTTLIIQTAPALLALILVWLTKPPNP
jgi:putative membrane protein